MSYTELYCYFSSRAVCGVLILQFDHIAQPWYYGTEAFPHPMAGLSYEKAGLSRNERSYDVVESLFWMNFGPEFNTWRTQELKLPPIPLIANYANPIRSRHIPFSAMWSPSFVPKPDDWPDQVEVVGTFTEDKKKSAQGVDVEKFADLIAWITSNNGEEKGGSSSSSSSKNNKPIFIGFGSMVIKDTTRLESIIIEAARKIQKRIIVQSSWSKLDVSDEPTYRHGTYLITAVNGIYNLLHRIESILFLLFLFLSHLIFFHSFLSFSLLRCWSCCSWYVENLFNHS